MILTNDQVLFDPERHQYTDTEGNAYPSVTTILKPWSPISKVPEWVLAQGRERGELVHLATEMDDLGTLDEDSLPAEVLGYLDAWRKFRREWTFSPTLVEKRFINKKLGYAGTLDRCGFGCKPARKKDLHILLDIKTGLRDPTHGPQTAAYAEAMPSRVDLRLTVYLRPDDYEVEEHTSLGDWSTFMAALQWHRWRTTHNL